MLRSFMTSHFYFSKCLEVLWRGISIFPNAQKFYDGAFLFFGSSRCSAGHLEAQIKRNFQFHFQNT
jgi:hypothetical protein